MAVAVRPGPDGTTLGIYIRRRTFSRLSNALVQLLVTKPSYPFLPAAGPPTILRDAWATLTPTHRCIAATDDPSLQIKCNFAVL
jgi:hypothetical protein